jgi:hypothetical protein
MLQVFSMNEQQQRDILADIRVTGNITQSCKNLGIKRDTFNKWVRRDPNFAAEKDRAMGRFKSSDYVEGEVPDFLTWRELHCAYEFLKDGKPVVQRAQNYWFQYEVVEAISKHDNVIFVLPPGHLKTTLCGIEYPTWNIMRNRNFRTLIIRANKEAAGDNVGAIGVRLSNNDYYAEMSRRLVEQGDAPLSNPITRYGGRDGFQPQGRKMGDRWSGNEFTVSGRTSGEKDSTVTAIGMDGAIPGFRADLIVIDDPQDPTKFDASGVENSNKLMKKWERDISGRLLPGGKTIILANRLGPDDFIGMMCERYKDDPDWGIVYFPAVIERYKKLQPLCPEVFTMEALEKRRRKVGEEAWEFHYMQEEIASKNATFTRDHIDACKDFSRKLGDIPPQATERVLGVDPAASGFTAMVAWGVHPTSGTRYLIDFVNEKGMKEDEIINRAVYEAQRLGCKTIVFEIRNIQAHMFEKLRDALRGKSIRLVPYKTATATGAQAQETDFSITSIGTLVDERMVSFPFDLNDHETQKKMGEFITQLVRWKPKPPGKSSWHLVRDLVMAMLFAESEARKFVKLAGKSKPRRRADVPSWAMNKEGGWADTPARTLDRAGTR